jgi:hypothetical protein
MTQRRFANQQSRIFVRPVFRRAAKNAVGNGKSAYLEIVTIWISSHNKRRKRRDSGTEEGIG